MPTLVIIRGPAGSGKSAISSHVLKAMRAEKVDTCYLEQDLFRNTLLGGGDNAAEVSARMLHSTALAALEGGYSVLLEGILNCNTDGGKFKGLIEGLVALPSRAATSTALRSTTVRLVYLNPSLQVTKNRHMKREKADVFGAEKLDKWWSSSNPTGLPGELILDSSDQSLEETVAAVLAHIGVGVAAPLSSSSVNLGPSLRELLEEWLSNGLRDVLAAESRRDEDVSLAVSAGEQNGPDSQSDLQTVEVLKKIQSIPLPSKIEIGVSPVPAEKHATMGLYTVASINKGVAIYVNEHFDFHPCSSSTVPSRVKRCLAERIAIALMRKLYSEGGVHTHRHPLDAQFAILRNLFRVSIVSGGFLNIFVNAESLRHMTALDVRMCAASALATGKTIECRVLPGKDGDSTFSDVVAYMAYIFTAHVKALVPTFTTVVEMHHQGFTKVDAVAEARELQECMESQDKNGQVCGSFEESKGDADTAHASRGVEQNVTRIAQDMWKIDMLMWKTRARECKKKITGVAKSQDNTLPSSLLSSSFPSSSSSSSSSSSQLSAGRATTATTASLTSTTTSSSSSTSSSSITTTTTTTTTLSLSSLLSSSATFGSTADAKGHCHGGESSNSRLACSFEVVAIGTFHSCFKEKHGTPRQGAVTPHSRGALTLRADIDRSSLEGLDEYSHLWLLFIFHENKDNESGSFRTKVAPPRAGGRKLGVFATRTPHRANPVGLSLVRLDRVDVSSGTLYLSGVDLIDGSPVVDIKPYHEGDVVHSAHLHVPEWTTIQHRETRPMRVSAGEDGPGSEIPASICVRFAPSAEQKLRGLYEADELEFYRPRGGALPRQDQQHFRRADSAADNWTALKHAIVEVLEADPRSIHSRKKHGSGGIYGLAFDRLEIAFRFSEYSGPGKEPSSSVMRADVFKVDLAYYGEGRKGERMRTAGWLDKMKKEAEQVCESIQEDTCEDASDNLSRNKCSL